MGRLTLFWPRGHEGEILEVDKFHWLRWGELPPVLRSNQDSSPLPRWLSICLFWPFIGGLGTMFETYYSTRHCYPNCSGFKCWSLVLLFEKVCSYTELWSILLWYLILLSDYVIWFYYLILLLIYVSEFSLPKILISEDHYNCMIPKCE